MTLFFYLLSKGQSNKAQKRIESKKLRNSLKEESLTPLLNHCLPLNDNDYVSDNSEKWDLNKSSHTCYNNLDNCKPNSNLIENNQFVSFPLFPNSQGSFAQDSSSFNKKFTSFGSYERSRKRSLPFISSSGYSNQPLICRFSDVKIYSQNLKKNNSLPMFEKFKVSRCSRKYSQDTYSQKRRSVDGSNLEQLEELDVDNCFEDISKQEPQKLTHQTSDNRESTSSAVSSAHNSSYLTSNHNLDSNQSKLANNSVVFEKNEGIVDEEDEAMGRSEIEDEIDQDLFLESCAENKTTAALSLLNEIESKSVDLEMSLGNSFFNDPGHEGDIEDTSLSSRSSSRLLNEPEACCSLNSNSEYDYDSSKAEMTLDTLNAQESFEDKECSQKNCCFKNKIKSSDDHSCVINELSEAELNNLINSDPKFRLDETKRHENVRQARENQN